MLLHANALVVASLALLALLSGCVGIVRATSHSVSPAAVLDVAEPTIGACPVDSDDNVDDSDDVKRVKLDYSLSFAGTPPPEDASKKTTVRLRHIVSHQYLSVGEQGSAAGRRVVQYKIHPTDFASVAPNEPYPQIDIPQSELRFEHEIVVGREFRKKIDFLRAQRPAAQIPLQPLAEPAPQRAGRSVNFVNITDYDTVRAYSRMAAEAYVRPKNLSQEAVQDGSGNILIPYGWNSTGIQGYIYVDDRNETMTVSFKGTSLQILGIGGPTGPSDRYNGKARLSYTRARET